MREYKKTQYEKRLEYIKEHYDKVVVHIPKGKKEGYAELAKKLDCSLNKLFNNAIEFYVKSMAEDENLTEIEKLGIEKIKNSIDDYINLKMEMKSMRILRIFKLTEDAENRGINWDNFTDVDIETVEKIKVAQDDERSTDDILYDAGYADSDIYGCEWE